MNNYDIDGNSAALEEYLQDQERPSVPIEPNEKLFNDLLRNPQYLWEALGPDAVVYPNWVDGVYDEIVYDQGVADAIATLIKTGDEVSDRVLGQFMREMATAHIWRCVEVKS